MKIIEQDYKWGKPLYRRGSTADIIIHHEAGSGMTAQQIHAMHRDTNGWAGIGYHFYIRIDGSVYRGRPVDVIGTHTANHNGDSIGVCFEGNYETTKDMPKAQYAAGVELLGYLRKLYPNAKIKKHKDYNATACPGKYFPFDRLVADAEGENMTGKEIYEALVTYLATLPESAWSAKEGGFAAATGAGLMDGTKPQGLLTREQLAAVLFRAGLIK